MCNVRLQDSLEDIDIFCRSYIVNVVHYNLKSMPNYHFKFNLVNRYYKSDIDSSPVARPALNVRTFPWALACFLLF
jgi:hypothetical protein